MNISRTSAGVGLVVVASLGFATWLYLNVRPKKEEKLACHTGAQSRGSLISNDRSKPSSMQTQDKSAMQSSAASERSSEGMKYIPEGVFYMGAQSDKLEDSLPVHRVKVDGFYIDVTEVTNDAFARFVQATHYQTVAERAPTKEEFPTAPPENLKAGSVVFSPPAGPVPLDNHLQWWSFVHGADWRHPIGPKSSIEGYGQHPVVHVAYADAQAYCRWKGARLPTEAEFEYAARGGLDRKRFVWGDTFQPSGKWMANTWQGAFPYRNDKKDGFITTAPVKSFPPNGFGLYDMAGNVWEWCSDWYRHNEYTLRAKANEVVENPAGPSNASQSTDPAEPGIAKRVHRGGSFLCTDEYCSAYMPGARGKGAPDTGTNHLGFRCVKSADL